MSGECDKCSEHALDCKCEITPKEMLELTLVNLQEMIKEIDEYLENE